MKNTETSWTFRRHPTEVGEIWLVARGPKLWAAELPPRFDSLSRRIVSAGGPTAGPGEETKKRAPVLREAARALDLYFRGELLAPSKVPLDLRGPSLWSAVWRTLRQVKPGRTWTYGELAERVEHPGAYRAVGAANGANRLAIFVPCHRIVSAEGALTGYGGGIEVKARLLRHEGVDNDGKRVRRD